MRLRIIAGLLLGVFIILYMSACTDNVSPNLEESLELYAGLEYIENTENSVVKINKGSDAKADGYFQIEIGNLDSNPLIPKGVTEAWCLEWKKPLRSDNDLHNGVKLFSTGNNKKWLPLTYFFSIKDELKAKDSELTYRELQAVIWSLTGYMGVAPEFDVRKLSDSQFPSRLLHNGTANFSKDKVVSITNRVLSEYGSMSEVDAAKFGGIVAQTAENEQDIIIPVPPSLIRLTPNPLNLAVSESRTMTARVFDEDDNEIEDAEVTWSIDDASIAIVDQNGVVTGVSVGQTMVYAESDGVTASAIVNVSQIVDNLGNEFIIGMLPNFSGANTVELHLTSDVAASVKVDYPINSPTFTTTVNLTPGDITIVEVPNTSSQNWNAGTVDNNAIRAASDQDFVMYAINRQPFTSDAALNLPVSVLGTEYLITSTFSSIVGSDRSVFSVVAADDNTQVQITPTKSLNGGFAANTTFTINLNRGEGFLGESTTFGSAGDLTGTTISSSKPVSVTNGNRCTNVPPNTAACDHIFQVAHPIYSWTTETVAAPLPLANRPNGSIYRVLASEDNTTVQQNGSTVATLDAGEFYETGIVPGALLFSADKPIFATQFMTGVNSPGAISGDPAMGSLIPTEQFLQNYTFSTVGGGQFATHYLNVIAHNSDVSGGTINFDGSAIPAGQFTAIAGTNYSFAQIELTEGVYSTSSVSQGHGIYVIGLNQADSYIYPGGAGISDL